MKRFDCVFLIAGIVFAACAFGACKSPIAEDAPPPVVDDDFNVLTKLFSKTANIVLDTTAAANFNGDGSRMTRNAATAAEFVYKVNEGITRFTMEGWYWTAEPIVDFDFYTSADGVSYKTYYPAQEQVTPNWTLITYTGAALPSGTKYLKIALAKTTGVVWNPQVGSVKLY